MTHASTSSPVGERAVTARAAAPTPADVRAAEATAASTPPARSGTGNLYVGPSLGASVAGALVALLAAANE